MYIRAHDGSKFRGKDVLNRCRAPHRILYHQNLIFDFQFRSRGIERILLISSEFPLVSESTLTFTTAFKMLLNKCLQNNLIHYKTSNIDIKGIKKFIYI